MLNESETGSSGVESGLGCAKELFPCIRNCLSCPYRFLIGYQCHTLLVTLSGIFSSGWGVLGGLLQLSF